MDVNTQPGAPQQQIDWSRTPWGNYEEFIAEMNSPQAIMMRARGGRGRQPVGGGYRGGGSRPGDTGSDVYYGGGGGTGGGGGGGGGGSDPMGLMNQMRQRANSLYWNGGVGQ